MNTRNIHKMYTSLRGDCTTAVLCSISENITPSKQWVDVLDYRHTFSAKPSFNTVMAFQVITMVLILSLPLLASAQDYTQTIKRSTTFENTGAVENKLSICNIHGSVTVEGYEGEEILITAIQEINGSDREVEMAKEELSFHVEQKANLVLIYLDAPFITVNKKDERIQYHMDRWDDGYKFLFDITVRVPKNTKVYASTITRGTVHVQNTTQVVSAFNVNGDIQLRNITGVTKAHTVNGDISVTYAESPAGDSDYQTVNGTIKANYPKDLSADIRFKSMHGDLYTDFNNTKRLQAKVSKNVNSRRSKTIYRLDRYAPIRIGAGGPTYSFEVLNGDVYIKQIKS